MKASDVRAILSGPLLIFIMMIASVALAATATMGESAVLASTDNDNANTLIVQQATLTQTGNLQSLSFYVQSAAGSLRLGVYDATGPSGGPGAIKAQTNAFTPVAGWNTIPVITPVSLPAGTYWLAYLPNNNGLSFRLANTGSYKAHAFTFAAMPAAFPASPTSGTGHWSFYATLDTGADTTPPSISAVAASSVTQNSATIGWTTNEAATSQVEYGATVSYGAITTLDTTLATAHSVALAGLTPSTLYHFRVRSKDAAGNEAIGADATFTTLSAPDTTAPSIPTNLTATGVSQTQVNLSWSASTDTVGVAGYEVFRDGVQVGTSATTTFSNTGLAPNTTYSFTVTANDAAGNVSGPSSSAQATTFAPDTAAPSIPINLAASNITSSSVTLSWAASTDDTGVTGYTIYKNGVQAGTSATPSFQALGLSSATTYAFTVAASDAAGNLSAQSAPVQTTTAASTSGVAWPLRISAQGKYLEDQSGKPFLMVIDAAWDVATQISQEDMIKYLDDRKARGFTAIEIRVIANTQTHAPNNFYNEPPFTNGFNDWSVRNEAYWQRVDFLLNAARDRGIVVNMFPAYLGYQCGAEGVCARMVAQTDAAMTNYGQWIGARYEDYGNIIWMTGGDTNPTGAAATRNAAIVSGIRSVDTDALFSSEPDRSQIGGIDTFQTLVDINSVYADVGNPDTLTKRAYTSGTRPFMYQEGIYENEQNSTLVTIEDQALITYLGGGLAGHTFGSCPLWNFSSTPDRCGSNTGVFSSWQNNLASPGSIAIGNIGRLMLSRKWWTLAPDYANTAVTSAKGSGQSYRAVAREATGETVMAWSPDGAAIAVNMTMISGANAHGWWYNPDNGAPTDMGLFATTGTQTFTPPSARRVLVLDDASHGLIAPGSGPYQVVADTTPPSTPTNLSATGVSQSRINLAWTASTDNAGVAGYKVFRDGVQVGTPNTASFADTGLVANTTYSYAVSAYDGAGNASALSASVQGATLAPDTTAPSVPSNLAASNITSTSLTLSWSASTDNTGVTGYMIYKNGIQAGTSATPVFQATGLTASTLYSFTVAASDGAGNASAQSAALQATTAAASTTATMGETAILASTDSGNANRLIVQQATLTQAGTLQSLSFYVQSAAGNLRLGVYDATGPSGGPGALKAQTNSFVPVAGWNTVSVTTPIALPAGTYWLAYLPSSSALSFRLANTGTFRYKTFTFAAMPATFPASPTSGTGHWSFYATLNQ